MRAGAGAKRSIANPGAALKISRRSNNGIWFEQGRRDAFSVVQRLATGNDGCPHMEPSHVPYALQGTENLQYYR